MGIGNCRYFDFQNCDVGVCFHHWGEFPFDVGAYGHLGKLDAMHTPLRHG